MTNPTQVRPESLAGEYVTGRSMAPMFAILAVVVVPAWMLSGRRGTANILELEVLLWAVAGYAGVRLTMLLASGRIELAIAIFWLFVYTAFGVAPLAQVARTEWPIPPADGRVGTLEIAAVLVLAGCVTFDVVTHVRSHPVASRSWALRTVDERRLWLISIAVLLATPVSVSKLGGLTALFSNRAAAQQALIASGLYGQVAQDQLVTGSKVGASLLTVGVATPLYICFLVWTVQHLHARRSGRRVRRAEAILWVLLLLANVVLNNPISNARYWFATMLVGLLAARPAFGRRAFALVIVGGVAFAVLLFPHADYFRNSSTAPVGGSVQHTLATKDYDVYPMLATTVTYVDRHGMQSGRQLLGDLFFFVPRSHWATKPVDTGTALGEFVQAGNLNLSSSLWSEGLVDFGLPGTLLYLGLLGYICRRLDDAYLRGTVAIGSVTLGRLVAPVFAGYELILLRGPLLQASGRVAVLVVTFLFLFRHPSAPTPKSAGQATDSVTVR